MKTELEQSIIDRLQAIMEGPEHSKNPDPEHGHSVADELLCEFLFKLGYEEVVLAYKHVEPKWYA